jgi:gamma-glutamyltranspeptidase/glutathione hydrolase
MSRPIATRAAAVAAVAAIGFLLSPIGTRGAGAASPPPLTTTGGVVASDEAAASQVGASVLARGGNAVDAAAATALALGVVNPISSGIGGGGFAVVYDARTGEVHAIDFREVAPAALTPDDFVRDGEVDPSLSRRGGLAVGVPGEVAGLAYLVDHFGTLDLRAVVAPARRLAEAGFGATWFVSQKAPLVSKLLPDTEPLVAQLVPGGHPIAHGAPMRRPRLARTLRQIALQGAAGFYRGPVAYDLIEAIEAAGGVMTREDLASYEVVSREPVRGHFHGYDIATMPLPSSGGLVLLEALGIVEATGIDLVSHGAGSSAVLQVEAEALKHAFADRARYLGDASSARSVADRLLAPERLARLARRVSLRRVRPHARYGDRHLGPATGDPAHDSGTSHLCVIDGDGNAVALTTTVNGYMGAKVIGERSGVVLNNEIDDFSIAPGTKNQFGLVQSDANLVGPGKRPLSSMTPTLVFKGGKVVGCLGGSGGPMIISNTFQVLLNAFVFGMDAEAAVAAPRIHDQWIPDKLMAETMPEDVLEGLRRRGQKVVHNPYLTAVQLILVGEDGTRQAASDPRKGGKPAAEPADP